MKNLIFEIDESYNKNYKKSLKISESAYRRTDNTMAKRKNTKGQTTIYKTLHIKLKIEKHELH